MITKEQGDLLEADVEALVNTVNTVGAMGKGIALQFRRAFPEMFRAYERAAKKGELELGRMHVWQTQALRGPQYIVNFPTKRHWRSKSQVADIEAGLADLVAVVRDKGIRSIAVPPLGCGNGGLHWRDVAPLIEKAFADVPDIDVHFYPPAGAPPAAAIASNAPRPPWTPGKAALVNVVHCYADRALEVSLIEVHKLMYFLQVGGEALRLNFVKGRYGPYAENLRHSLVAVEGHFLSGFGGGSQPVQPAGPISVLPGAAAQAAQVLAEHPEIAGRIERVLDVADGFESAYGLGLLASVHWVATEEDAAPDDADRIVGLVADWSPRKKRMFGPDHVRTAWQQLRDRGWIGGANDGLLPSGQARLAEPE